MAPIIGTIEVARPAEEVFSYVTDPSRMPQWQPGIRSGRMDSTPVRVGSRCITMRKIGGVEREVVTEITEYDSPRRWADHGIEGPVRAVVSVSVDPVDGPGRTRVTIELDFEGHGIGKLLVPLMVRPQARRQMPGMMGKLKQQLEPGGAAGAT